MAKLTAHGSEVTNVFQLIGTLENDITKSIAWGFCKCPVFLGNVIQKLLNISIKTDDVAIKYQTYEKEKGITDLEITDYDSFYMIIEAKRGWILPDVDQLAMYSSRSSMIDNSAKHKIIVSMSECSEEYADLYLPAKIINGIHISHISWKSLYTIADKSICGSNNAQKNILRELRNYLGGIASMQKKDSNWVYVVSIADGLIDNCQLSWKDVVNDKHRYFHPVGGNGWPKEPVNYIAFRYNGKLQSIHHVDNYNVVRNLHVCISEMPDYTEDRNFFVYHLGPAIKPDHDVKTGKIFPSGRVWAMLDLLLTSDTVSQARDLSNAR